LTGVAETILILAVIGSIFLIFIQVLLYSIANNELGSHYKEAPMKKISLSKKYTTMAILTFICNFGTSLLDSVCLQA